MPDIGTHRPRTSGPTELPHASAVLLRAFGAYTRWYLRRHFHGIRVSTSGWLPDNENSVPKVIYLNHASWWDPLVCLHLQRQLFSRHAAFAPIDAKAVEKYAFFKRLGFFGVETDSPRGAARFFRVANQILAQPWNILWVTPQGHFADVRERPIRFKHGVGHLASRLGRTATVLQSQPNRIQFVPLAIEYTFWHERLPEILLHFGQPLEAHASSAHHREPEEWTRLLENRLDSAMQALSVEAQRRQPDAFLPLLKGSAGVGFMYDSWRRVRSLLQGRRFDPKHGRL